MRDRGAWLLAIAVLAQVLAVVAFAGVREVALHTGREIVLKTIPVDPRDLFRGDYVVLRYEISDLPNCYTSGDIYVRLRQDGEIWRAAGWSTDLADAASDGSVVMKGRITHSARSRCEVAYGIESYFTPEGQGRDIERLRGELKVRVVVDGLGAAAIKGLVLP